MKPKDATRPKIPYAGFPLLAHSSGQWSKYIPGKGRRYFGPWADPASALERFKREFPYLQVGLEPPPESLRLYQLLNAYDDDKKALLNTGRIKLRTYNELIAVAYVVRDTLGRERAVETVTPLELKAINHKLAVNKAGEPVSPVSHKRKLTYARMIFRFGNEMLGCNFKYREALKSPEKRLIRERRAMAGERMFAAKELRSMLKQADPHMRAVIYLGLFAGFGPDDCINLTPDKIKGEFIDYARPKTGVARRCWLPLVAREAVAAIADNQHVFNGRVWNRHVLAREFRKLCEDCAVYRKGITSPYSLRRTMETVSKNADVNQSVIDRIMGHERPDMSEVYNQRVFDKQLRKCAEFIQKWLDGKVVL